MQVVCESQEKLIENFLMFSNMFNQWHQQETLLFAHLRQAKLFTHIGLLSEIEGLSCLLEAREEKRCLQINLIFSKCNFFMFE